MVTAVVGAGGKTTLIRELSARFRAQGKRVLVTTSTHMFREPDTLVDAEAAQIAAALQTEGFAMAGSTAAEGKIGPLPPGVYAAACAAADEVLVEADGARGHIVLVINLKAEGLPLCVAAHHPEQVAAALGVAQDTPLTPALLGRLAALYRAHLRSRWPDKRLRLHLNYRPDQQALAAALTGGQ